MGLLLEHIDCDLCGGKKYRTRYRKPDTWLWRNQYEYPVVECADCGLVYVNPRPTVDSMACFYPEDYHSERTGAEWDQRYASELSYLPSLDGKRLLDVGCASGDFLAYVKRHHPHAELYGVDTYSDGVKLPEIDFHGRDLTECDLPSDHFDVVTAWAVFEHLHQPSSYFKEVQRILRAGGLFAFLVTNSESLYGRRAYAEDVPRHTYHYSEKTLRQYAGKFGFELKRIDFDDRIWDGRGHGTFRHLLERLVGATWEKRYLGRRNRLQSLAGRLGRRVDKFVFRSHWEARSRRSGILIGQFVKRTPS